MPSYISHTIMAREVYEKLKSKRQNINVSLEYMLTFSLGGDLTKFSKCRYISHNKTKKEFFKNMIDYIKKNNLQEDNETLGVLYGHICHYAFDDITHPLVRRLTKECKQNKKNHRFIENYYDIYLAKEKQNKQVNKYNNKELFKGKMNKKITNIINYSYEKTYQIKNISKYYKFNIWLYKKIKYLYLIFGIKNFQKVTGYTRFLQDNRNIDLLNNNNKVDFKNQRNTLCKDSFDMLYNKAVERSLKAIREIDSKLKK